MAFEIANENDEVTKIKVIGVGGGILRFIAGKRERYTL